MKSKFAIGFTCALFLLLALRTTGADKPQKTDAVIHIDHEKVAAALASGSKLLVTDAFKVQTGHRTGPGEVELHDRDTDIFYILEGSATFVTGGTMVGAKNTAPGQIRAASVEGGKTYHLTKGDVITIPAKTPHWFKDVSTQTIAYYAVNLEP